jgi:hypothetical protein
MWDPPDPTFLLSLPALPPTRALSLSFPVAPPGRNSSRPSRRPRVAPCTRGQEQSRQDASHDAAGTDANPAAVRSSLVLMELLHPFSLPPHYSPWKKPTVIHGRHEAPRPTLHLSSILYKRAAELLSSPSHNRALFLLELPLSLPLAHAVAGVRLRRRRPPRCPWNLAEVPSAQHLVGAPSDVKNPCSHAQQHHRSPSCLAGDVAKPRPTLCLDTRSSPFAVVRSPKVEDNPLIYFLNYILNLTIYRVIL